MKDTNDLSRIWFSDWDAACLVLYGSSIRRQANLDWVDYDDSDLDYDSQLIAIRELLARHRSADEELEVEIQTLAARAKKTGNEHAGDAFVDHVHMSVYQGAAHSMAAVGLLAPFIESVFRRALLGIEHLTENNPAPCNPPKRLRWMDIVPCVDGIGMRTYMPDDLESTLSALFKYRNNMFHCGFEWPIKKRREFNSQLKDWPSDWFSKATSNNDPWVFYMSPVFIKHCLVRADQIIAGVGRFCKDKFLA